MIARQMPDLDDETIRDTAVAAEDMRFTDLADLSPDKLDTLARAVTLILQSGRCEETFTQIIDGKPTRPTFLRNHYAEFMNNDNISDAMEPSKHATQCYKEIREAFDITVLKLELKLVQAYQNTDAEDSTTAQLRFLEIVAACINTLAGIVYKAYHPKMDLKPRRQPEDFYFSTHYYVDFYHASYKDFERYPFGLLNVVGYWAESEIFGGVLLFNRGLDGSQINSAYLHTHKREWECHQLSQQHQIAPFFYAMTTTQPNPPFPLPFIPEQDAHTISSMHSYLDDPVQVYKNEYDRPPRIRWKEIKDRERCVDTQAQLNELLPMQRRIFEARGKKVDW